ncbi:MAG: hypothetical protein IPM57_06285 [Oligoflexia bacterium]|nr:hypothetical protein [Oligoflexia bacterium]
MIVFLIFLLSLNLNAYEYKPIDKELWGEVQKALKENNFNRLVKLSQEKSRSVKKDSLENAEAQVVLGMGLTNAKVYFGATAILSKAIKEKIGTEVAKLALSEIEAISKTNPIDEDAIYYELLNDLEFDNLDPDLQDFVSFHQGLYSQQKGYAKWSDEDFKKIRLDSYWDFKLKYINAIKDVSDDKLDQAIEKFSQISQSTVAPEKIKTDATHQYARLLFEKADYPQAYKIFKTVTLNPREKGLILLERAWAKYYQKDYGKALGLLAALDAPYFDPSRSPEQYILKMIMFKELCYYDAAFSVLSEFNKRYAHSLRAIKKRQDLRKDQMLVNMAVIDKKFEKLVNFLDSLKTEKLLFKEYSWDGYGFYNEILRKYDLKIKEVTDKLNWLLLDKTRQAANTLLDWKEQLTFLDYQTRLDSLRVLRPKDEVDYKPEEIPRMTFDKMFWESSGEFWIDELENLKMFVESKCTGDNL